MSHELIITLQKSAAAIAVMMIAVWLLSLWRKDSSIIDLAWGPGFVLIAWLTYWSGNAIPPSSLLLPCLTTAWGLRLGLHLTWRNRGKPEDFRYRAMREKWGNQFPLVSLVTVFGLQGIVMWIVSLPLQAGIAADNQHATWLSAAGVAVWAVGFSFECIGDWQLARFKSVPENAGRVLDTGLWRFTRHPNYFGEFVLWWGLFLIAAAGSGAWWTAIGPIVLSFLLLRVSGVTLLEKTLRETKPDYAEYIARTNAFWPGRPRRIPYPEDG